MEENFRILNGDELFRNPNRENPNSDNTLLWIIGSLSLLICSGILMHIAYREGRESVMPRITQATPQDQTPILSDPKDKNAQVFSEENVLPENRKMETATRPQKNIAYQGNTSTWHS